MCGDICGFWGIWFCSVLCAMQCVVQVRFVHKVLLDPGPEAALPPSKPWCDWGVSEGLCLGSSSIPSA